jgi:predicted P-loop ATPase
MEVLFRATVGTSKSFITEQSDPYRPPWARHKLDQPRQCVFFATINPDFDLSKTGQPWPFKGYLPDRTGNRRYWPFQCGEIDLAGLERDRQKLLAEAVRRFEAGEPWHLETPQLEALAAAEQALRCMVDPWRQQIEAWLEGRRYTADGDVTEPGEEETTSVDEVLKEVFDIIVTSENPHQVARVRVAKILKGLKFRQSRPRKDGRRAGVYWRAWRE